jgi:hypothetical protein
MDRYAIGTGWEKLLRGPFLRLVRHCVDRIFSSSEGAEPGELDLSIATVLALLAMPGAFISVFCMDHYGSLLLILRGQSIDFNPYTGSTSDEYFFIVLAMVVAGGVAVWKWDRLMPDRHDYANLAPLPIASSRIFLANLTALSLLAAVLSFDVNAVSSILFPLVVCALQPPRVFGMFFATHTLTIFAASAFGFFAVFAVLGFLMALFSYRVFRKVSLYVRCGIVFMLMALLTTSISVPRKSEHFQSVSHPWTYMPPPACFLGLCQVLRGDRSPLMIALCKAANIELFCVVTFSLVAYSLSYARFFVQNADTKASMPYEYIGGVSAISGLLDSLLLRSAFQRACYRFAFWTISRSEEQAFVFGGFLSLGVAIVSQILLPVLSKSSATMSSAIPSAEILSVPLIVGFFLILGLRLVFEVPASLRSNWIFKFLADAGSRQCQSLARKIILTLLVPALTVICLPAYSYFWGLRVGLVHTLLVATWCVLLMEGSLVVFRKIPFTCSLPKFKSHVIVSFLLWMLAYFAFTSLTPTVESWALVDPLWFVLFVPVLLGFLTALHFLSDIAEKDRRILFDEQSVAVIEVLNLKR